MKPPRVLSLRVALSLLFVFTSLVALVIVGSITLAIRLPQSAEENRTITKESATEMVARRGVFAFYPNRSSVQVPEYLLNFIISMKASS